MVLGLSTAGLAVLSGLTLLGFAAYQTLQCELDVTSALHVPPGGPLRKDLTVPADSNELKLTQQEFTGVPFTITVELLVAAGVTMWGEKPPCIMQPYTLLVLL